MKHIFRAILLLGFQMLVLNNFDFSSLLAPQVYFLFILLLPLNTPHWALMLLGFGSGLLADTFTNTPGMHAFTATFWSFIRYYYIRLSFDKEEIEIPKNEPTFVSKGLNWFLIYLVLFIFGYHLLVFFIEWFSGASFGLVLQKAIYSSAMSLMLILIILLLFIKPERYDGR